jgi:hypothetical protein
VLRVGFEVDELQEPDDVPEHLLGDSLARAVDGELDVGAREHHGRREHGHRDGLAEAPRGADQDLLGRGVPAVVLQDPGVVLGERPRAVPLEEDPRAGLEVLLVELPLVEGARPPPPVQRLQGLPADVDPLEAVSHLHRDLLLLHEAVHGRHRRGLPQRPPVLLLDGLPGVGLVLVHRVEEGEQRDLHRV